MQKKLLIFDFDGTIADTLAVALEIINDVGSDYDIPTLTATEVSSLKQKHISELMEMAGISWYQLPLFIHRLRDAFRKRIDEVNPIVGMQESIRGLAKTGYKMGILTSNSRENVLFFLEKFDLPYFEFVIAPRSIFGKAGAIKDILKRQKLKPGDIVMIGDEVRDLKAAYKVGVDAIGVSWGFNSISLLEKENPLCILETPDELLTLFNYEPV